MDNLSGSPLKNVLDEKGSWMTFLSNLRRMGGVTASIIGELQWPAVVMLGHQRNESGLQKSLLAKVLYPKNYFVI